MGDTEDGMAREALMPSPLLRPKPTLRLNLGTVMVMDTDILMDTVMVTDTTVDGTERGLLRPNPKLMLGTDATMVVMEVTMAVDTDMVDTVDTTGDKFI